MTVPCAQPRILLVDDHDSFRQATAQLLELLGFCTVANSSPLQALENLAQTSSIELLITDFCMVPIDGAELARRVKRLRPTLPILVISSQPPPQTDLSCADAYLMKPFSADDLRAEIGKLGLT